MKIKTTIIILVWLAAAGLATASTNDITTLVQKGLFEEEASHHLDAAMEYYQEAIGNFDKDRQLTATAIFHLGECYRLQGKPNEANVQYQRIVREFSDQPQLVELSRSYLPKTAGHASFAENLTRLTRGNSEETPEEQDEVRRIKDSIQNSPDLVNPPGRLADAARKGWMSVVKLLVDNGATVNPQMPAGWNTTRGSVAWTPLSAAADAGNRGMVEYLLAKGANVNALDSWHGFAALHCAVANGFKAVAETLLAHGADADLPDSDGDRPLHLAASHDYVSLAEALLARNAGVNSPGKGGETALLRAVQNNRVAMVQFLISNKADVNIKSESGETPLLSATRNRNIHIAIVKALLDSGADVASSLQKDHPIDLAVGYGRADIVELLLQNRANPDDEGLGTIYALDQSFVGQRIVPPLSMAIASRADDASKIASLLLQYSANPNLADEYGELPLDYAILYRNTNVIGDLIAHHADVNAPDKQGDPPLAYVTRLGVVNAQNEQIKEMFIRAGASEDYRRRGAIFITQKGTGSIGSKVFSKGTNSVNRYTLFDLIATAYGKDGGFYGVIAFPDLAHVTINRLRANGGKEEIAVDLSEMLRLGDSSRNPGLEWGDIVLIPQLDHKINEGWQGLSESDRSALAKCLLRKVKIIVKGQTTELALLPSIVQYYANGGGFISEDSILGSLKETLNGTRVLFDYDLNNVVRQANVLLISSDLSRVKVTRRESVADGKPLVMEFNLEGEPSANAPGIPNGFPGRPAFAVPRFSGARNETTTQNHSLLQLLDGDVIEIPERDQK